MQSKQGVTLSTLGYSVDCLKSVYNYYSTVGRFFQVNNSIIAVIIDNLESFRYNRKKAGSPTLIYIFVRVDPLLDLDRGINR